MLRSDWCELPSISTTDREDVTKISDWSAARVKVEKFEEIDFDKLVTDETLRQFLGYQILSNKKTVTKRGTTKRKDDAPRPPRPAIMKRTFDAAASIPKGAPLKKNKNIPLATSRVRRTPKERQAPETNTEEGSMSFQGFVPEASSNQGEGSLPPFGLKDKTSSEASHHGSEIPLEEPEAAALGATSPTSLRMEVGAGPTPETNLQRTPHRVKHMAKRKNFEPRGRLASLISKAEQMLGRPKYSPSEVEGFQPELASPNNTEEGCEREETLKVSLAIGVTGTEDAPPTPISVLRGSPQPPEGDEGM